MEKLDFGGCAGNAEGLGPGKRAVLWVRGCPLACPGCMTPELWAAGTGASQRSVEEVASILRPLLEGAQGLTISGGEPMQQPKALTALLQLLRRDLPQLEVLVYSGYTLEELLLRNRDTVEFLGEIDMLIDGRFVVGESNTTDWRGSDNQRLHCLSERSQKYLTTLNDGPIERPLQVQMLGEGQFRIIGIPRRGDLERFRAMMEQRGLKVEKLRGTR
jgi:anaerobic ribonucleoside-triphosphate reductase activating protein